MWLESHTISPPHSCTVLHFLFFLSVSRPTLIPPPPPPKQEIPFSLIFFFSFLLLHEKSVSIGISNLKKQFTSTSYPVIQRHGTSPGRAGVGGIFLFGLQATVSENKSGHYSASKRRLPASRPVKEAAQRSHH